MINYEGRTFQSAAAETAGEDGNGPVGHYHQNGPVVWADFAGGKVVRGMLVGRADDDGVLHLAYSQLMSDGEAVSGRCTSVPTILADGRIRLDEHWQRCGQAGPAGVSIIVETAAGSPPPASPASTATRKEH